MSFPLHAAGWPRGSRMRRSTAIQVKHRRRSGQVCGRTSPPTHAAARMLAVGLSDVRSSAAARRQVKREGGPLANLGFDSDRSAQLLGETEDLTEAEAGALAEALGREERLEHPLHRLRTHAGAGVDDPKRNMLTAQSVRLAVEPL